MPEEAVILSTGMMTAVGLTTEQTAASVRAGTAKFKALAMRDKAFDAFTVAAIPDEALPPLSEKVADQSLTHREARLLRLGSAALAEALKPLAGRPEKPALCLALPDMQTRVPLDRVKFLKNFGIQGGGAFVSAPIQGELSGRAAGLLALREARKLIAGGQAKFAIAGGIDSYLDLYVLGTLDLEGRVKSSRNLDGFIPGEGAGFVLLASRAGAELIRAKPLAAISPAAEGLEPGHLHSKEPYLGEGLAGTVQRLLSESPPKSPLAAVWSSMNGESHWGKEWSLAYNRNKAGFAGSVPLHHPADCYGDTGAAAGPLMAGLAALGIAGGYRPTPALVYCSSDRGQRAALIVSAL